MTRPSHISEDLIRERAYRLWVEEGQPQGKDAEHWERARELLALEADPEEAVMLESQGEQEIPKKRRPSVSKSKSVAAKKKRLM